MTHTSGSSHVFTRPALSLRDILAGRMLPVRASTVLLAASAVVLFSMTVSCRSGAEQSSDWRPRPAGQRARGETAAVRFVGDRTSLKLAAAANETVGFTFAIQTGEQPIIDARLSVAPFSSARMQLGEGVTQVFLMQRVSPGPLPGWHVRSIAPSDRETMPLDVLVPIDAPRGGMPDRVPPRTTEHFWVDVSVPSSAAPGTYRTTIQMLAGRVVVATMAVELEVWPFTLPDDPDLPIIVELDHTLLDAGNLTENGLGKLGLGDATQRTVTMLRAHRLTPVLPELNPRLGINNGGSILTDWSAYDSIAAAMLGDDWSTAPNPWPLPVSAVLAERRATDAPISESHSRLQRTYFEQCAAHFEDRSWLERSYAMLPGQSPTSSSATQLALSAARALRSADDRIAVAARAWPQDMAPYGWTEYKKSSLRGMVDVWVPPAQFYDRETMAAEQVAGHRAWFAIDRPPFSGSLSIHAPSTYARVLSWQAKWIGADALYAGAINAWPTDIAAPSPQACLAYDPSTLLYPGESFGLASPVASVRLKQLRQSAQDAAYRQLLHERSLDYIANALTRSLVTRVGTEAYRTHFADGRPVGWASDPTSFELAREIMAHAIIDGGDGASQRDSYSETALWRRFLQMTNGVGLSVDGSRVHLRGRGRGVRLELESFVTIENRTRLPLVGTLAFTDVPAGWEVDEEGRSVAPIPPGQTRRYSLTASGTALPGDRIGSLVFPIELTDDAGVAHRTNASLAVVIAMPLGAAISVDGDLSDWPLGATNVAAGFRLISGGAAATPRNDTLVFVMRDLESVYLAINCLWDIETSPPGRTNIVPYDDQIPQGDDIVEVLLDPLNSGSRSPGDLFHIVVKPTGSYSTEKGIRFDPPVGRREPWAADIEVATRRSADRWTAELRIPLVAFDDAATEHTVWGLNITRYDEATKEFSNWSGAVSNAYDPLSLGNLIIP